MNIISIPLIREWIHIAIIQPWAFCSLRGYNSLCGCGLSTSRVLLGMFCLFLVLWKEVSLHDTLVP